MAAETKPVTSKLTVVNPVVKLSVAELMFVLTRFGKVLVVAVKLAAETKPVANKLTVVSPVVKLRVAVVILLIFAELELSELKLD